MEQAEVMALLAGVAAGAWGARLAGAAPWKGGAVVMIGFASAIVATLLIGRDSALITILAAVVIASIVSGAIGLRARQTSIALLGGWSMYALVFGVAVSYAS